MKFLGGRVKGMTLIELMVALAIGMVLVLAVTSLLIVGENHKRVTTSTNDAEQTGAAAVTALDRALRSAGSGIAETAATTDRGVLGCRLNVAGILPRVGNFPAPFNSATLLGGAASTLRVAPLLIAANGAAGGDVLIVMAGSGSAGGVSRQITSAGSSTTLPLDNTVGFSALPSTTDLVLVSQNGVPDCLLEQVSGVSATTLSLGGTYYTSGTTTTIGTLASNTSSYVTPLGSAAANNVSMLMYGVDVNRTLYSYDLLQNPNLVQGVGVDAAQPIADGVYQMHAIYGLDTNGDGIQDAWAGPADMGYDVATVMTTEATMRQIISVRVALVVRGEYYEKTPQSATQSLTLFQGLSSAKGPLTQTIFLTAAEQHYRYRVFEFTVPLRNMLLLAGA